MSTELRAVDLYSGIGGWSLGLRMAGIVVAASFDKWAPANDTNARNNRHNVVQADVRGLKIQQLPTNIAIVVGSPPCTQFSYSNRGGGGDLNDGIADVSAFLRIVQTLRPRHWVLENVPRLASVLPSELSPGGRLHEFAGVEMAWTVCDLEQFGLPQRRRRCLIGNIDFTLLNSYRARLRSRTLGEVILALSKNPVVDPCFGMTVPRADVSDHVLEPFLDEEEVRINAAAKTHHPIYNRMAFPDSLARSVRTVTATCTRVSRESIVIEAPEERHSFRRLTIRERASLQGFPVEFDFFGNTQTQKLRMVGNAVPPLFAYLIGQAIRGTPAASLPSFEEAFAKFEKPGTTPRTTTSAPTLRRFPRTRRFRFALPTLHLKSGVRFELANKDVRGEMRWEVAFYFGSSTSINSLPLKPEAIPAVLNELPLTTRLLVSRRLNVLSEQLSAVDVVHLQDVWAHAGPGGTRPFSVLDTLDEAGKAVAALLRGSLEGATAGVRLSLDSRTMPASVGFQKLLRNSAIVAAGILVGATANGVLCNSKHVGPQGRALVRPTSRRSLAS